MWVGLALTLITVLALVRDQTSVHSLAAQVDAHYSPFGLHPDPNVLFAFMYVTAAIGMLLWLTTIWAVRRQKPGIRLVASAVFVGATGIAALVLLASEYEGRVFPTIWGVLGLLPCIAGLVAVALLWTRDRKAA